MIPLGFACGALASDEGGADCRRATLHAERSRATADRPLLGVSATNSFASVMITAKVLIHLPEAGSFQFSRKPAMPNGVPSFMG